jgi:hypothetical protein
VRSRGLGEVVDGIDQGHNYRLLVLDPQLRNEKLEGDFTDRTLPQTFSPNVRFCFFFCLNLWSTERTVVLVESLCRNRCANCHPTPFARIFPGNFATAGCKITGSNGRVWAEPHRVQSGPIQLESLVALNVDWAGVFDSTDA